MTALLVALAFFFQDPDCRTCGALEHVAAALSEGDTAKFLRCLDKNTPGYPDFAVSVEALTAQQDIAASLDVLKETGDDRKIEALVDWYMQFTAKDDAQKMTRRRMRVRVVLAKQKNDWKVIEIDPRSILDPVTQ